MGRERGYSEVKTPLIYDAELWKISGHWGKYRENMFTVQVEEREMGVKPMNCPGHAHLFAAQRHSYRELPVRYSEPGLLHRNEPSGVLHGLLRVQALRPGRRAHLLHRGAGAGGGQGLPGDGVRDLRAVRLRGAPGALDAPGAADRHAMRCGIGPRRS